MLILEVLFETCEVLQDNNATPVIKVVAWHTWVTFKSSCHSSSILFHTEFGRSVADEAHTKEHMEPVGSVLSVVMVSIVIHWVGWSCSFKISSICSHEMLEFNNVFRGYSAWIWVIVVNEIMNLWRMEFTWWSHSITSNWSSIWSWNTTIIVT